MADQNITPKINNHISKHVQAVTDLVDALNRLRALHEDYEDNGYSGVITQDHITGDNVHLTPTQLANSYSSWIAVDGFIEQNFHDDIWAQILP